MTPCRLQPSEIQMLALEGGGGKGAAYLGALGVFADPTVGLFRATSDGRTEGAVLDKSRIKKIAGSSAGAITATLVACGYSLQEIHQIVTSPHLRSFYDLPNKLERPRVGRNLPPAIFTEPSLINTRVGPFAEGEHDLALRRREDSEGVAKASLLVSRVIRDLIRRKRINPLTLPTVLQFLLGYDGSGLEDQALPGYVRNLLIDFGFMSGKGAREIIDSLIAQKTIKNGTTTQSVTFEQFFKIHGVELMLTGTRLETGTSHYFSRTTTPTFRVADAVRISMSIPVLFKPVVIQDGDFPGEGLAGTWVDGGTIVNLPIHAFDSELGVVNDHVLGLRLGVDAPRKLEDFGGFLGALVETLMSPSELGQIRTPQEQAQTVVLPTGRLSTAEFLAPNDVLREAVEQSAMATMRYFGMQETSSSFLNNRFNVRQVRPESLIAP